MGDKPRYRVALALVCRDGLWLVARRPKHVHLGGMWEFPGGKLEPGEDAALGALRELFEECGVRASVERVLEPIDCDYGDRMIRLYPIVCRWTESEPRPLGCEEVRWVRVEEMEPLDMPAANNGIIRALRESRIRDGADPY
ncbi:MAG: (deoxy)nucleoside triphosphate pyrophosphohydrolase [Phycisphaerae bacterium]